MYDDTNPEVVTQEPEAVEQATPEQGSPQEVVAQPTSVDSDSQKNFRQLREKSDRIAQERDEAVTRLREYEARFKQQNPEESDEFSIAPDDLAEGKHLNKVQKQINKLKGELVEAKLKAQYPDFDSVVSRENIEELKAQYPELARTLNSSTDLYSTAVSAYTIIKKMGLGEKNMYDADKAMAQKNAAKPKPLASVSPQQGDSPLSKANAFANGLTDELKNQMRREMNEARRNM